MLLVCPLPDKVFFFNYKRIKIIIECVEYIQYHMVSFESFNSKKTFKKFKFKKLIRMKSFLSSNSVGNNIMNLILFFFTFWLFVYVSIWNFCTMIVCFKKRVAVNLTAGRFLFLFFLLWCHIFLYLYKKSKFTFESDVMLYI